jgi:DHA1 family bicyclomycin/chloramphenicol resistance-like MFS transporter
MWKNFLPILLLLSLVCACVEIDLSVPSFLDIAGFFGVSDSIIQSTITYNFLGFFIGALFMGPLSDTYGRRKIMLAGNAILFLGAVGCTYAPSIYFLLASRFVQGVGASTSVVLVYTIIADLYDNNKAIRLFGVMNAALAIVLAGAPALGGFINLAIGWRGSYALVALFSAITWLLLLWKLPESKNQLVRFNLTTMYDDYKQLVTNSRFIAAAMIPNLLFAAYMAYMATSAFIYMGTFDLPIYAFVGHQTIIVLFFTLTSIFSSKIIALLGPYKTAQYGVMLTVLSALMLIIFSYEEVYSAYLTTILMSLFSIGFAMCYPVIFADSLSIIPILHGPANSFIMSSRALLTSLFTGLVCYVYAGQPINFALAFGLGIFCAFIFAMFWLKESQILRVNYES